MKKSKSILKTFKKHHKKIPFPDSLREKIIPYSIQHVQCTVHVQHKYPKIILGISASMGTPAKLHKQLGVSHPPTPHGGGGDH